MFMYIYVKMHNWNSKNGSFSQMYIYIYWRIKKKVSTIFAKKKKEDASESSASTTKKEEEKKAWTSNSSYQVTSELSVKHSYPRKEEPQQPLQEEK